MIISIVIGVIFGVAVLAVMFKPFFGGLDGFLECLKFYFTPDVISLFRGNWGEDRWSEMKLFAWIAIGTLGGLGAWGLIEKIFN